MAILILLISHIYLAKYSPNPFPLAPTNFKAFSDLYPFLNIFLSLGVTNGPIDSTFTMTESGYST